jgi:filamentous hemagglutinin
LNVTGNITGGNLNTAGQVVATGNVRGGNIVTAGLGSFGTTVNATGNITGGNLITAGLASVTGNVTGGNIVTAGQVVATGNVTGGNIVTAGLGSFGTTVNATGNITGGNLITAGQTVTTGNITGGNINTGAQVVATGNITGGNIVTAGLGSFGTTVTATGNITGGNLITAGQTVTTGNITGGNINTGAQVVATGNITGGNIVTAGSGTFGNIVISGSNVNSNAGRITMNSNDVDVDFAVDGDTVANVFYVDAGTGTASFGSSTQTTNAVLALNSTNSVLIPVGTTGQRPDPGTLGMLRFNSTLDAVEVYTSADWTPVGTPEFTVITDQQFNGNGVGVAYTLANASTTNSAIVSINGVLQLPTVAYSVSGTTLTFTEAPQTGDIIDVRVLTTTTEIVGISNSPGTAVIQPNATLAQVDVTGNLIPTADVTYNLGSPTARWNELFLAGNTITLGNTVIKNTGGNTIGFFGPNGTTPATIDPQSVDTTTIANGTSSVSVLTSGGNIRANVGGATVVSITGTGANITGELNASGNVSGGNLNVTGNLVDSGPMEIITGTNGNIALSPNGSGVIVVNKDIRNGQANGVGNIGASGASFNTIFARATSAQYADLAENYAADAKYAPGTVLSFGGEHEVTVSTVESDRRIAGVVSTNPSYIMNSVLEATHVATVALTGRVPTLVSGPVSKGDMMVSDGNGRAIACATPAMGTVIGKALENHPGGHGTIEVVVGRL